MNLIDSPFVDYLEKIGADYTVYHAGNKPRINLQPVTKTVDKSSYRETLKNLTLLSMKPENISKIMRGKKTATSRTGELKPGLYKLQNNAVVELSKGYYYKNISDVKNPEALAKAEGYESLADWEKNTPFPHTREFIQGKRGLWVYKIKPAKLEYSIEQKPAEINSDARQDESFVWKMSERNRREVMDSIHKLRLEAERNGVEFSNEHIDGLIMRAVDKNYGYPLNDYDSYLIKNYIKRISKNFSGSGRAKIRKIFKYLENVTALSKSGKVYRTHPTHGTITAYGYMVKILRDYSRDTNRLYSIAMEAITKGIYPKPKKGEQTVYLGLEDFFKRCASSGLDPYVEAEKVVNIIDTLPKEQANIEIAKLQPIHKELYRTFNWFFNSWGKDIINEMNRLIDKQNKHAFENGTGKYFKKVGIRDIYWPHVWDSIDAYNRGLRQAFNKEVAESEARSKTKLTDEQLERIRQKYMIEESDVSSVLNQEDFRGVSKADYMKERTLDIGEYSKDPFSVTHQYARAMTRALFLTKARVEGQEAIDYARNHKEESWVVNEMERHLADILNLSNDIGFGIKGSEKLSKIAKEANWWETRTASLFNLINFRTPLANLSGLKNTWFYQGMKSIRTAIHASRYDMDVINAFNRSGVSDFQTEVDLPSTGGGTIKATFAQVKDVLENKEKSLYYNGLKPVVDFLTYKGMFLFIRGEYFLRKTSFISKYLQYRNNRPPETEWDESSRKRAIDLASEFVLDTQFDYTFFDKSAFARTPLGGIMTRYSTYTARQLPFNYNIYRDFVNIGLPYMFDKSSGESLGKRVLNEANKHFLRKMIFNTLLAGISSMFAYDLWNRWGDETANFTTDIYRVLTSDDKDQAIKELRGTAYNFPIGLPAGKILDFLMFVGGITENGDYVRSWTPSMAKHIRSALKYNRLDYLALPPAFYRSEDKSYYGGRKENYYGSKNKRSYYQQ